MGVEPAALGAAQGRVRPARLSPRRATLGRCCAGGSCPCCNGDGDEAATSTTTTTTTAAASVATPLEGRWTTRFTDPNGLPPGTWVFRVHGTSAELTNPRQPSAPFDLGSPLVVEGGTVTDGPPR